MTNLQHEAEANAFAMALLMPKKFLIAEIEKMQVKSRKEQIKHLSEVFKVNAAWMEARLLQLGLII